MPGEARALDSRQLDFDGTLLALLDLLGREVAVSVCPDDPDGPPPMVAVIRGRLRTGHDRRDLYMPFDSRYSTVEVVFFELGPATGFFLSRREFIRASWSYEAPHVLTIQLYNARLVIVDIAAQEETA